MPDSHTWMTSEGLDTGGRFSVSCATWARAPVWRSPLDAARLLQQDLLVPLPEGEGGAANAWVVALEVRESAKILEGLAREIPGMPTPIELRMEGLPGAVLFTLQAGPTDRCVRFSATICAHKGRPWIRVRADIEAPVVRTRVLTGRVSMAASIGGIAATLTGLWLPAFALTAVGLGGAVASRLLTGGVFEHDRWRGEPALSEAAATLVSRFAASRSGIFVRRDEFG